MRLGAILVLLVLAGCGGSESKPEPQTTPAAGGAIEFAWTGTIIGRDDRLRIEPDGSATLRSREGVQSLDLPERVVARVRQDLAAADLGSLDAKYGGPVVSDGSEHSISAGGVTVESSNGGGPPQLDAVLADLTDIVANADYLVRFRIGIRTTIGPDLATMEVGQDGFVNVHTPNSGNTTVQLSAAQLRTIRAALDATPFEADGEPGFSYSREPLDEDQVVLVYRWLTLKNPPASAKPAIAILRGLL